jgi:hypothetical protein
MKNHVSKEVKDRLALALLAKTTSVEAVEAFADEKGLVFSRKRAVADIELLLGEDEARRLAALWLDEGLDVGLEKGLAEFAQLKRQQASEPTPSVISLQDVLAGIQKMALVIKRTAQEMLDSMSNPQPSGLQFATRSDAPVLDTAAAAAIPVIEPSLDLEVEANTLYISLVLCSDNHTLPNDRCSMVLIVDGQPRTDFVFERSSDGLSIDLSLGVDQDYVAHASEKDCTLRFNPDLQTIAVIVGSDPLIHSAE